MGSRFRDVPSRRREGGSAGRGGQRGCFLESQCTMLFTHAFIQQTLPKCACVCTGRRVQMSPHVLSVSVEVRGHLPPVEVGSFLFLLVLQAKEPSGVCV